MSKQKHSHYLFLILIFIITLVPAASFAANGDGTGAGNSKGLGENKDITLTLESASVSEGASDVAVNETIQLNFNKNICNVTVLANNKKCFHLTDAEGNAVAIQLIFPDSQVQRDYLREVFIRPVKNLRKNTQYRISIDNTLTAKNGTAIDNAHTLTFTTGAKETGAENKVLKKLGENTITYETAYGENANSIPVDKSGLDNVSQQHAPDTGGIAMIAAIILIFLIVVFTIIFIVLRRKRG